MGDTPSAACYPTAPMSPGVPGLGARTPGISGAVWGVRADRLGARTLGFPGLGEGGRENEGIWGAQTPPGEPMCPGSEPPNSPPRNQ